MTFALTPPLQTRRTVCDYYGALSGRILIRGRTEKTNYFASAV